MQRGELLDAHRDARFDEVEACSGVGGKVVGGELLIERAGHPPVDRPGDPLTD